MSTPSTVQAFRREVVDLCSAVGTSAHPFQVFKDRSGPTDQLYRELGARGWLSMCWPSALGGEDRPPDFEFALWDELAYHRLARPSLAAGLIAKSLIAHGTPEQRREFLPRIADGTFTMALGYSEPEAGSDLTGLRCRARRDGEAYIVTGEKRWTSDAHHADAIWLLARTGSTEDRARGLTLLIVDRDSPGVTVSPIDTIDDHQLNEVRLDEVVVPESRRVGAEGEAWPIISAALARERHLQVLPGRLRRDLADLRTWAADQGRLDDDHFRSEYAEIRADLALVGAASIELVAMVSRDEDTTVVAACQKLTGTELMQRIARLPSEHGDPHAVCADSPFEFLWRQSILETIAGGTTQIMRDLISRRALALGSRDPRPGQGAGPSLEAGSEFAAVLRRWATSTFGPGPDPGPLDRDTWTRLAELGVLSLCTDEGGGSALEMVDAVVELGYAGVAGPLVPTLEAAQLLDVGRRAGVLDGTDLVAVDHGRGVVPWGAVASLFVRIDAATAEAWLCRAGTISPVRSMTGEAWARVELRPVEPLGEARAAVAVGLLAQAAYLTGAGLRAVDEAAAYAGQRVQFGKPIGSFQAVAHPLADSWARLRALRAALRSQAVEEPVDVAGAAALQLGAARHAVEAAYKTYQTFGGMGFAAETSIAPLGQRIRETALLGPSKDVLEGHVIGGAGP